MKKIMKAKKVITMALLIAMIISAFTFPAYAAGDDDLNDYSEEYSQIEGYPKTVRWSFTNFVSTGMGITGSGDVIVNCNVDGYSDITTKIVIYSYVQRHVSNGWVNVAGTSDTFYDWYGILEETLPNAADWGYDYRVYSSIYVYSGTQYEHINAYSGVYHYHSSGGGTDCTL